MPTATRSQVNLVCGRLHRRRLARFPCSECVKRADACARDGQKSGSRAATCRLMASPHMAAGDVQALVFGAESAIVKDSRAVIWYKRLAALAR